MSWHTTGAGGLEHRKVIGNFQGVQIVNEVNIIDPLARLIRPKYMLEKEFVRDAVIEKNNGQVKQRRREKGMNPRSALMASAAVVEAQGEYARIWSTKNAEHIAPEWET